MTHKPHKVLILGSGALKIGEAGEFDYSGSQAIKALKEERVKTIVINPNIATYQTSHGLADKVYFLPVDPYFTEGVIKKERPDAVLLAFGGQTALNCGLALARLGILKKYNISVIGTPIETIEKTEDRDLFVKTLQKIGLKTPKSRTVKSPVAALKASEHIGFPVMVRAGFALGGLGSGVARTKTELEKIAREALRHTHHILVEEYLGGWKEIEYELVRDERGNCISVCNMENFDPLGVHTGESIVVAPSQTLNNAEYHGLREIAIKLISHLGIIGECNIQFALNPHPTANKDQSAPLDYRIIEVNARLSRSSALASKATGYPLAFIAAKLALGARLTDLKNAVTKTTSAFFEPAMDYVVVKIPRWDLDKFIHAEREIGSSMKSVGEVMAIGRNFEEALQKANRMLGLDQNVFIASREKLCHKYPELSKSIKKPNGKGYEHFLKLIKNPNEYRLLAIAEALKHGVLPQTISKLSGIDKWFIHKIKNIIDLEYDLKKCNPKTNGTKTALHTELLRKAKQNGFSDKQIAILVGTQEQKICSMRQKQNIKPKVNHIDTLAAEYPAQTNYLYLTYHGAPNGAYKKNLKKSVIVFGSGVYRIGSSVEFDWCGVISALTLKKIGYRTIIINNNPETVSTDYDMADKLYFEEINLETIKEIYHAEQPEGIILSMGGQTANNLALPCFRQGLKILGTSPEDIDRAENRFVFSELLRRLGIDQPEWKELTTMKGALEFAQKIGFPVLVRPSYVLSGAAMNVGFDEHDLKQYLGDAVYLSPDHPVVMSKFIVGAKEIEIDAVAQKGEVIASIVSEHIENAGVHSGDATIVTPPQKVYLETIRKIKLITARIAQTLRISGPFNLQFLAINNDIKVIECNLRASRSFPFASKVTGINLIELATKAIMGKLGNKELSLIQNNTLELNHVGVKAPQFSFNRIKGADPILRVEMASTGEVGTLGATLEEAFLKSLIATGFRWPKKGILISLGGIENKIKFLESAFMLAKLKLPIYATENTAIFLHEHGVKCKTLYKIYEHKEPNVGTTLQKGYIDLVINITESAGKKKLYDESTIRNTVRRTAVDYAVPILTDLKSAGLFVSAISTQKIEDLEIKAWDEYV
ncbi:MAG: Carbamoyl-phosphate synthase, large subunit [Parcubacteria group bacterium GW2011_GWA2_44_12]|nr:MAG: Carbamoyl-phosphate synthase, large subunit [Parcubacteria group bacterium GW2011_GWA2_44_12]